MRRRTLRMAAAAFAALSLAALTACTGDDPDPSSTSSNGATEDLNGGIVPGESSSVHVNNPYAGAAMYINDEWSTRVQDAADAVAGGDGDLADAMRDVSHTPTGVWMDRISAIEGNSDGPGLRHHLDAALEQSVERGQTIVTLVIYDLPGRDCFALASNGELPASDEGLSTYKSDFIDVIAATLAQDKYAELRVATIIEPDSLPNLVTNASDPNCQQAAPYYREGVAYALDAFAPLDNVYSYLDAGHAGWLGWESNAEPTATLFADVVESTEAGFASVEGFVTNTANYTPLEEPFLPNPDQLVSGQAVKSGSFYEYNPDFDESDWTADLYTRAVAAGFPDSIGMLIDTSRNGWGGKTRPTASASATSVNTYVGLSKVDLRPHRGAWCNQDGAGLGRLPQALPDGYPDSHLDAFIWAKPPGESDGSSEQIANDEGKGFDQMCDPGFTSDRLAGNATNALPDAPLAGQWFDAQFAQLVKNAYPAVGEKPPAPREDPDATLPAGQTASESPTPSDSPSTSPSVSASPSGLAGGCSAQLVLRDNWNTGFVADVTITASAPVEHWLVTMALPPGTTVRDLWTGTAVGDSGTVVVGDVGWNGALAQGETAVFGFTGDGEAPSEGTVPCEAE